MSFITDVLELDQSNIENIIYYQCFLTFIASELIEIIGKKFIGKAITNRTQSYIQQEIKMFMDECEYRGLFRKSVNDNLYKYFTLNIKYD